MTETALRYIPLLGRPRPDSADDRDRDRATLQGMRHATTRRTALILDSHTLPTTNLTGESTGSSPWKTTPQ